MANWLTSYANILDTKPAENKTTYSEQIVLTEVTQDTKYATLLLLCLFLNNRMVN